jgi:alpha-ribazole phosphatase
LVRHAPVHAEGLCYGQCDVPVRIAARDAAEGVLAALGGAPSSVVASPWARATDLGSALAKRLAVPLSIDARLSELAMGEWEGRAFTEIERTDGARLARWMEEWRTRAPPGGETVSELEARVASWLASRRAAPSAGPLLVITHAGPIRALRSLVYGRSWDAVMGEPVEHLAVEEMIVGPDFALPRLAPPV